GSHLVDRTLGELEERLDPRQFVRIHRSAIVNLAWVAEVRPDPGGRLVVRLKDATPTELQVARDRVRAFKERLGLYLRYPGLGMALSRRKHVAQVLVESTRFVFIAPRAGRAMLRDMLRGGDMQVCGCRSWALGLCFCS